ncbi:MAG: hypothetical protein A2166_06720 [Omnitrophica WOR_2 bacterium RBG_13_41_10]|nr:MAG: hypothetical protein A2166_06720 [Omnitrophica WOR_2 bacterium RBG_13_41_10]
MIIIWSAITAIATVVIAIFAWVDYLLYKAIQRRDEEYKNQTKSFFQALVISNLVYTGQVTEQAIAQFKAFYKGATKIFE